MTQAGYAFLGLTAIVAALAAVLVFALLRFAANARDARRSLKESGETPLLAAALQEAVAKLKAQQQAMTARAMKSRAVKPTTILRSASPNDSIGKSTSEPRFGKASSSCRRSTISTILSSTLRSDSKPVSRRS